jgi:hypothetical protein
MARDFAPVKNDIVQGAASVTTSDSADLTGGLCRGLYVGTTGNVKVTMASGEVVTFNSMAVGYHPLAVSRVWATGTTASNINALY